MSGLSGRAVSNYVGLLVLALVAGLVVPLAVAAYVAGRDPLSPSCHTGLATSTSLDGAITWANGPALWFADGDFSRARRLVNHAPPRPQLQASPGGSPTPSSSTPAPPPSASPSSASVSPNSTASVSPSASPSPGIPATAIEAAAITPDHALVAYLLSNPPDHPGTISLLMISPQSPPGTPPKVVYSGDGWLPQAGQRSEVLILPQNRILFMVPARFNPPIPNQRFVGVAEGGDAPKLLETGTESDFLTKNHSLWPETKDYKLPPYLPRLRDRVIGPEGVAAGVDDLVIQTPLVRRTLNAVRVGRAGSAATTLVCATSDALTAAALAPDERRLAVVGGENSYLIDLGGGRGLAFFTAGRVLDWRG